MRTTLDLPDELMRSVKVLAAQTDRSLTETISDLLRAGLEAPDHTKSAPRVELPLVRTGVVGEPQDFAPERIAQVLSDDEVGVALGQMSQ